LVVIAGHKFRIRADGHSVKDKLDT
jgi:hypothetical protein